MKLKIKCIINFIMKLPNMHKIKNMWVYIFHDNILCHHMKRLLDDKGFRLWLRK